MCQDRTSDPGDVIGYENRHCLAKRQINHWHWSLTDMPGVGTQKVAWSPSGYQVRNLGQGPDTGAEIPVNEIAMAYLSD